MFKSESPLVSIIIPCYKAERELPQALNSVSNQSYKNWELIAVNDCWEDGTESILQKFKNENPNNSIRFIRHAINQGPAATRNTGLMAARGELIAFLDHDDIWEVDHLFTGLNLLKDNQADIYYSSVLVFDHQGKNDHWVWGPTSDDLAIFPQSIYQRNFIQPSSTMISAKFIKTLGLMDTNPMVQSCEDHDYWIRAVNLSAKFITSPKITSRYRYSNPEAASAKTFVMLTHDLNVQRKHFHSPMFNKPTKTKAISNNYRRLSDLFWRSNHFKSLVYLTMSLYWYPRTYKNYRHLIKGIFYWPKFAEKLKEHFFKRYSPGT